MRKVGVAGQHGHTSQFVVVKGCLGYELHRRGQLQRAHLGVGKCARIDKDEALGQLQDGLVVERATVERVGADTHHCIGHAIMSHRSLEIRRDKVAVACPALGIALGNNLHHIIGALNHLILEFS